LDLKGVACSKGSACQSGSNAGSHVIKALHTRSAVSHPSLRFSFSSFNTKEDVDYAIAALNEFVAGQVGV
jgi:cysteine desulfurase